MTTTKRDEAVKQFATVINRFSLENESDTPDFILAEYLMKCLEAHACLHNTRKGWYEPGEGEVNTHQ